MARNQYVLPILAASLGLGAVTNGLYGLVSPSAAARVYGVPITDNTYAKGNIDSATVVSKDEAYVYAHGSRNLALGTSVLGLTAFWTLSSTCQISATAAQAVKRCIGITLLAGSVVPIADVWFIRRHLQGEAISGDDAEKGKKSNIGHAVKSFFWVTVGLWHLFE